MAEVKEAPIYTLDSLKHGVPQDFRLDCLLNPPPLTNEPRERRLHLGGGKVIDITLPTHPKSFPPHLRYDTRGLELYDKMMAQEEYYLPGCEKEILKTKALNIAAYIPDGSSIVELGCGSMVKTSILLDSLRSAASKKNLKFYALDIDEVFLKRSLKNLQEDQAKKSISKDHQIEFYGILGFFEEVQFIPTIPGPRMMMMLGSTLGMMGREEAKAFMKSYQEVMEENDTFLVGMDKRNSPEIVGPAYNDRQGASAELGMNTLAELNRILGKEAFEMTKFQRVAGFNEALGRVESYIKSLEDQDIAIPASFTDSDTDVVIHLDKDEYINYAYSMKFSMDDLHELAKDSGLKVADVWTDSKEMYYLCLFRKTAVEE